MSKTDILYQIIEYTKHYGSIVSTPGVDPKIVEKCNAQLKRLVDALDSDLDILLANYTGLITNVN